MAYSNVVEYSEVLYSRPMVQQTTENYEESKGLVLIQ